MFNNPKPTLYLIILFVVLFFAAIATKCHAGVIVSGGGTMLRGPAQVIDVVWTWNAPQSADAHWETGLTVIGASTYEGHAEPNNFSPSVRYVDGFGHLDLGLGLAYVQNRDDYNGSNLNFSLLVGTHWKAWHLKWQHISNAGTQSPNLGRDLLLVGYEF